MSALILPHRLQTQPQQVAVVDRGNSVTRGLRAAALPGMAEAVTGALPVQVVGTGGLALGATTAGRSWALTQDAFEYSNIPWQAGDFSTLVVLVKSNIVDTVVSFGGSGAGRGWRLSSGATAASARLTFGNVADYALSSDFWDVSGGVTVALLTVRGTTARLFRGGVLHASITVGAQQAPTKPLTIGAQYSTSYSGFSDSSISLVALWGRALSDAEAISLSGNPWQLFKAPARRLWATSATAPAGQITGTFAASEQADTLAASGVASLTAITGTASSTEAPDTLASTGGATSSPITGAAAASEAADSLTAAGAVLSAITGSMLASEAPDTLAAGAMRPAVEGSSGGGAGSVREVRDFAAQLDRVSKPTKVEKKRRKQAIEAAVLELLPDEPAAERVAPVIAQIVARELPPATWAPVHGPRPVILPPAVVADVRARVAAWLAEQQFLAELEDEFETELLLGAA